MRTESNPDDRWATEQEAAADVARRLASWARRLPEDSQLRTAFRSAGLALIEVTGEPH